MTLGPYLKSIRESRRQTLRDVEQASGVSNAYLSQLETGKIAKPSPHFLLKLAKAYDVPHECLMEKAGYLHQIDPPTLSGFSALNLAIRGLTADEEADVLDYVDFLRYKRRMD